ncbi:serine/threonine protein kinase [Thiohalobacter thiocyanaticus]|uniref:Stress response kinase A n=1 Tax=Thiohalobacter thiocyanaticus TaxID=585455 RepID=A0A1Z4VUM1_9GAMM|nr:serine/threonine protein kinase [Thiohalobacter thiocyanaticus]BAZ95331.1 serine/threonine protein kinase [Thiohalobacter thiocyanaticus]
MDELQHAYAELGPATVLDAVDAQGFRTSGHLLALNSYENRVYQIGLEDAGFLVAKFYRPRRWSDAAIREEHAFCQELVEAEIPVVAPLADDKGETLFSFAGFRYALYPRRGGRWPDLDDPENLEWLGRYLARVHNVGQTRPFAHRPRLDVQSFGVESYQYILEGGFIPPHLDVAYRSLVEDLLQQIEAAYAAAGRIETLRLHGDFHPGNILWTEAGPHFVDLDDCRTGPAVQDIWMLLSGERSEMALALSELIEGYELFREFNRRELALIEPLRTLRMIHYAAWLARRWDDPAFHQAFPWFNTDRYWEEHILGLREQAAAMNEPPLTI